MSKEVHYKEVYDEVVAMKRSCGEAHLKVILEIYMQALIIYRSLLAEDLIKFYSNVGYSAETVQKKHYGNL